MPTLVSVVCKPDSTIYHPESKTGLPSACQSAMLLGNLFLGTCSKENLHGMAAFLYEMRFLVPF